jgi:hypothetical protein
VLPVTDALGLAARGVLIATVAVGGTEPVKDGAMATAARLWGGSAVAIDPASNVLFVDDGNNRVRKVVGIAAPGLVGGR